MARKKVREYDSKRILRAAAARVAGLELPIRVAQVRPGVEWAELATAHPWLLTERLVAKPDCLFGKRGKHDLVGLNLDFDGARAFVEARAGRRIEVAGVSGAIDVFVVEPFVPHAEEYYMCIQSKRDGAALSFSEAGGVDVEENWDAHVRTVHVPVEELTLSDARAAPLLATLAPERRPAVAAFLAAAYAAFLDCDFTLLEANPFTLDPKTGAAFPLDLRGELDDTAAFRSAKKWEGAEFPMPFGRDVSKAEAAVAALDESTGSSLKLTLLNPRGRIWTMVAGGGASVIYSDTVADLGFASELANYAEYSGGPSTAETYGFARELLGAATAAPDGRGRALIVGGGIANFTDVAATFTGITQALRERADALRAARFRVFVRRGGPNYKSGLAVMKKLGEELGIEMQVFGPEASMTGICVMAADWVRESGIAAPAG